MSEIVIIGGGIGGLSGAMMLAREGHHVTVLERDPAPPSSPGDAWADWERRGVNQFRLPHLFLPRFRELLETELPDVAPALEAEGALRTNQLDTVPEQVTGGWRTGDERFVQITGRRPMIEATLARLAENEPGVEIRRGVAVRGIVAADHRPDGVPHVVGVVTDNGQHLSADLVVDAGGRRSAMPDWLEAIGARRPVDDVADSGFVYYGRHFRSADGAMPPMFGPPLQPYESVSILTLVGDNGHWSVTVTASAKDAEMRGLRRVDVWERVVRSYPLIAHWIDAEPITDVDVMAKIEDRVRRFVVDGTPVATGVVAVADSWACTNPSVGRGASIALLHVSCLRDVLRKVGADEPLELSRHWDETTAATAEPLVDDTLHFDRHRLAQIEAQIAGVPYESDDPAWRFGQALNAAAAHDPDLLRAAISVASLLERGVDVLGREGIMDKLLAVGDLEPLPGPSRSELVGLIGA